MERVFRMSKYTEIYGTSRHDDDIEITKKVNEMKKWKGESQKEFEERKERVFFTEKQKKESKEILANYDYGKEWS